MKKSNILSSLLMCVMAVGVCGYAYGEDIPDFTKGEEQKTGKKDTMRPRVMGPTGLWGITYAQKMKEGATRDARQFLITQVDPGSPADGKILAGAIVLGVDGQDFSQDARKALAAAIHKAEETDGKLSLRIWREGNGQDITLMLQVLGAYDRTNPYDCPHTERARGDRARGDRQIINASCACGISYLSCTRRSEKERFQNTECSVCPR